MKVKLTQDELFLCTLAQKVDKSTTRQINRYTIGQLVHQNNKSVDNTVQLLVKTNFVKRGEGDSILITAHGLKLVEQLGF
jgi:hypothetical protein